MSKKKSNNEPREVASVKQTSGEGFVFEDKVSAWFLADFLTGKAPIKEVGTLKKIHYQTKADGWELDDLLLTCKSSLGDGEVKIPVSSKSNRQINGNGPNQELLSDLWNQFLNERSSVFNTETDYLCVVNAPLPVEVSKDLNQLIKAAKTGDRTTLDDRITKGQEGALSQSVIKLFNGFACPDALVTKHGQDKTNTWALLSRLVWLEFDFENDQSKDEARLRSKCLECLKAGDEPTSGLVFNALCTIRRNVGAVDGGYMDEPTLINHLSKQFELRDAPWYSSDWEKLNEATLAGLELVRDKIGGELDLPRETELHALTEKVETSKVVFITGVSGSGKSVIAKKLAAHLMSQDKPVLWLDSRFADGRGVEHDLQLRHNMKELIANARGRSNYLFVDGLDRFYKGTDLTKIIPLMAAANAADNWRLLISCQTEDYEDLVKKLYRKNLVLNGSKLEISSIEHDSQLKVTEAFPALASLFKHRHLKEFLGNLKYLDLLAYTVTNKTEELNKKDLGETDIIDYLWNDMLESVEGANSDQCSRFLQMTAQRQADELSVSIAKTEFEVSDLVVLPTLKQKKAIREYKDRLYFTHDLWGDWARYRMIRSQGSRAKNFMLSLGLSSPLWCKAIRLYGVSLLEREGGTAEWIKLYQLLNETRAAEKVLQDLLLESLIYSAGAIRHLEALWSSNFFQENEGLLLARFLDQFMLRATQPNPEVMRLASRLEGITISEAASYNRFPIYLYWPAIIIFLHNHRSEIPEVASLKAAGVVDQWLRKTGKDFLFRKEAAETALQITAKTIEKSNVTRWSRKMVNKTVCRALFASINEFPEEVTTCARRLSGRIEPSPEEDEGIDLTETPKPKSWRVKVRDAIKWEDGPYEQVGEPFRESCLDAEAIHPVMEVKPELAEEVILAALIDPPHEQFNGYDSHYEFDLTHTRSVFYPPFYTQGPFLKFLQTSPKEALDLIIRLVNFVTDRWVNKMRFEKNPMATIKVRLDDLEKNFIGDQGVYFWYRDMAQIPDSVVSALMALEKYLIDQLDGGKSVSEHIDSMLHSGNSVAFLGLLNSVGKYAPQLFKENLGSLLEVFTFYEWEMMLGVSNNIEGHQMASFDPIRNAHLMNAAREWHSMPQRKKPIVSVAQKLNLLDDEMNDFFKNVVLKWQGELAELESGGQIYTYMNNLIAQFDRSNYQYSREGNTLQFHYNEPPELTEKLNEVRNSDNGRFEFTTFPLQCYQAISENKEMTLMECEEIWEKLQKLGQYISKGVELEVWNEYDSLFGGCALLEHVKPVWNDHHPDWQDWIQSLIEGYVNQLQVQPRELPTSNMDFSVEAFLSRLIVNRWLSNPEEPKGKSLVAQALLKAPRNFISPVFKLISEKLKWNDPRFVQVQNLVIEWSVGLYKFYMTPKFNEQEKKKAEAPLLKAYEQLLNSFVKGKSPSTLIDWSVKRIEEAKRDRSYTRRSQSIVQGRESGIDTSLIHMAFTALPQPTPDTSADEYAYILKFWDAIVEQLTFEFGEISDDAGEYKDNYNDDFKKWATKELAQLMLNMNAEDRPERYWKPILDYGFIAGSWVDSMADHFWRYGVDKREKYDWFVSEWDKMLLYVKDLETWKPKWRYHGSSNIENALLGLSDIMMGHVWKADYSPLMDLVSKSLLAWIAPRFVNQSLIGRLIRLMRYESGTSLIKPGILLLKMHFEYRAKFNEENTNKDISLREFEHNDSLATTLSYLWENHRSTIKGDDATLEGFKALVIYLVSIQNAVGVELQGRLIED